MDNTIDNTIDNTMNEYESSKSESEMEHKIQESLKNNHFLSDSSDSTETSKSESPHNDKENINDATMYVDSTILTDIFENINLYAYSWEENSFNIGINEKNEYYAKYTIYFDQESLLNNYDKSFKYILILKPLIAAEYVKKENGRYETDKIFVKNKILVSDFASNNVRINLKILSYNAM
jgi:hypothetical protein